MNQSHSNVSMTIVEFVQKYRRIELTRGLWEGSFYFSQKTYITQSVFIRILFIVTKNLFSLYFGKPFILISILEQCLGSSGVRFLDVAPSGVENFQLTNKEAFFIFLSFARQRKTRIGINEILLCVVDPVVRVLTCLLSLITRYAGASGQYLPWIACNR